MLITNRKLIRYIAALIIFIFQPITITAATNNTVNNPSSRDAVPVGAVPHTIGNVWCDITNYGWLGDADLATPSMEWPGGTGNMYLYQGSLWIAGINATGAHCTAGDEVEWYPQLSQAKIDAFTAANGTPFTTADYVIVLASSNLSSNIDADYVLWYDSDLYGVRDFDDDRDGLVDEDPLDYIDNDGDGLINEDFAVVSAEDTYTMYNDLWLEKHRPGDEGLGLEVIERTYAWDDYYNHNFIIFEYEIINVGRSSDQDSDDPLLIEPDLPGNIEDVYIGIRFDGDISNAASGEYWYDDLTDYDHELNISYIYDADDPDSPEDDTGEFGLSEGYLYAALLSSPADNLGRIRSPSSHNWWTIDDDPSSDALKYQYMSNGVYATVPPVPYDYRFLQSVGPYDMAPDDTVCIIWAMGVGTGYDGIFVDVGIAHWMANNEFIITGNPPLTPPRDLVITNYNINQVSLRWESGYADYYAGCNIHRADSIDGPYVQLNVEIIPGNTYTDSTITAGNTYYYTVTVEDIFGGESGYSSIVQLNAGAPTPPGGLIASIVNSHIELNWHPHSDTAVVGFNVYRSQSDTNSFTQLNIVPVTTNSFSDLSVVMDSTYFYAVTAVNQAGYESLLSGISSITLSTGLSGLGILLVDDDEETPDQLIDHNFHYMFRHFNYTDWDVSENGIPTSADLLAYSTVIWYTDDNPTSFYNFALPQTDNDYVLNPIPDFLDAGGHLWLMGGEIIYFTDSADTADIFASGKFLHDYLHLDNGGDVASEFTGLVSLGVTGFSDIGIPGLATGTGWPDELVATSELQTIPIYELGGSDGVITGIFYNGADNKVVFWGVNASFIATNGNPLTLAPDDMEQVGYHILMAEFGEAYLDNPAPIPPNNFNVSGWGEDYINLVWDESTEGDIMGYNIYRAPDELSEYAKINSDLIFTGHIYQDSLLSTATEYWYSIKSVDNALQEGEPSLPVMEIAGRPHDPAKPSIISQSGNTIELAWDQHPENDVIGYNLYGREFGSDSTARINTTIITDSSYVIQLSTNAYYISLTAIDSTNIESYPSGEVIVLTGASLDQGILLIDNFHWTPGCYYDHDEINTSIDAGFMYGFQHTDYDVDSQGPENVYDPFFIGNYSSVVLFTDGGYRSAEYADMLVAYGLAGGNLLIMGYNNAAMVSDILSPFGFYPGFFGTNDWPGTGMDGFFGTDYENFHIDVPNDCSPRNFERVYSDADHTYTIFNARNVDGDNRSCAVRSEMPNGNIVIIIGQSLPFLDQNTQSTKDLGRYILETEFGEQYLSTNQTDLLIPDRYELYQNYPNPFNPTTTIRYSLPRAGSTILTIYNLLGQEVIELVNKQEPAGLKSVNWNGFDKNGKIVGTGVYFYQIRVHDPDATGAGDPSSGSILSLSKYSGQGFVQTRKMVVLK